MDQNIPETLCGIGYNGEVLCVPAMKYTAHCDADYTNYPYDVQKCIMELASWSYSSEDLSLSVVDGVCHKKFYKLLFDVYAWLLGMTRTIRA